MDFPGSSHVLQSTDNCTGSDGDLCASVSENNVDNIARCGSLTSMSAAGGVAYVFAKKSINADRQAKAEEQRKRKAMIESLEYSSNVPTRPISSEAMGGSASLATSNGAPARTDTAGSPSQESSRDPAPTRHAPTTERQRVVEKSKYESNTPFKSIKGDRFS